MTAVLALHYQNDVLHEDGKIKVGLREGSTRRAGVIAAARAMIGASRACGVPVVHVRVAYRPDYADLLQNAPIFRNVAASGAVIEDTWGARFHDGLEPLPGEFVVKHARINAFYGSSLNVVLQALGVRRLVVAGVATHSVVETTVRHAVDAGFEVLVNSDACAAGAPEAHDASLASMRLIATVCDGATTLAHLTRKASP
ncbi:cysteine hydrolase family protein [Massilia niabensis]|uniref:Cysteine hydrolase family protein n=1 Tax=Massilia niabensis TaxID=544910 RepID=A0ABW0L0M8_9BURK